MDKCVQAIEWTVDGRMMNRTEKSTTKKKNEESICIKGQCKAQSVTFTYIFNTSVFQIEDKSLKIEINGFREVCAREKEEEEKAQEEVEYGSEAYLNKDEDIQIMVGSAAGGFVLLIFVIMIVAIVKMRKNVTKEEDLQSD